MAKIRKKRISFKNLSLKQSFMVYMLTFVLIGIIVVTLAASFLSNIRDDAMYSHVDGYDEIEFMNDYKILFYDGSSYYFTDEERVVQKICDIGIIIAIPGIPLLCIIAAGLLFYRNKLKKPIFILDEAAGKIANNDLDFHIQFESENEMGRLCRNFEQMRSSLDRNNREMWRAMEERKRLNAAFSHDLRTPLTVLRGYVDMLEKYVPNDKLPKEKLVSTVKTMSVHVTRLENYVASMHALQKLEDVQIYPKVTQCDELAERIRESADILCKEKQLKLSFQQKMKSFRVSVDTEIVMQVLENLLSNGIRFANKDITVSLLSEGDYLTIEVGDDGKGFSPASMLEAIKPFYKEKENVYDSHFGLGLNICKILCEKHGGFLSIKNGKNGGGLVEANFKMVL